MLLTSKNRTFRRGATAVLVAIILPVLILIVGFAVDLAFMQLSRAELRAATDLAAKAASAELATSGKEGDAKIIGKQIAALNFVAGEALTLESGDFKFGNSTRSTTGKWVFDPGASPKNAVRITSRRTAGSPDGPVNLFFAGLLGSNGFETTADATSSFINADICLVLDRSSSMKLAVADTAPTMSGGDPRQCDTPWADSRWVALENAVNLFVAEMDDTLADEHVAVVTFASDYTSCSTTVQAATLDQPLTGDLSDVTSAMSARSSQVWNGMTEISVGMQLARTELTGTNARATAQKIMVVLTDGAYTNGVHPSGEATTAANNGITVHTITFGAVPSNVIDQMETTATAGGGNHYHAPDAATLNMVFAEIAGSIAILTE